MTLDERTAVAEQRSRLVRLSRQHLLEQFDRAAAALRVYVDALGLEVVRPLFGASSSPNVLREVRDSGRRRAVLKLCGDDARGEAATIDAWTAADVPRPPLLEAGYGRHADEVTHLLLGWVDGDPLTHREMPAATAAAVALFTRGHLPPAAGTTPLARFLHHRFSTSLAAWRHAGFEVTSTMEEALAATSARPVLLHGDTVGDNLLRDRDRLVMLDPAGVHGPRERDAATWVARSLVVPGPAALPELRDTALEADRNLERTQLDRWLGVELVIEVGYRLRTPHAAVANGADPERFDDETSQFAELTTAMLSR